uniref:CD109 antigen n=1 Tax=Strigamia maritima TaxID=126957 RepID=T1IN02_STRMM
MVAIFAWLALMPVVLCQQLPPQNIPMPPQAGPPFPFGQGVYGPNMGPNFFGMPIWLRREDPTHMILASKVVRPGSVYRVIVHILRSERPVGVRASVSRDGVEVGSANKMLKVGIAQELLIKVPPTSVHGRYKLRVEGNANGVTGGTVFANETNLEFSSRFLTVLIQTNRPVYNRLQIVRFRIILITTDLKPYTDPVEVSILDPNGFVMRRWFSAYSNVGTVTLHFTLPSDPVQGYWTILVTAQNQEEKKLILVEKYWPARFEVNVNLPTFLLDSDRFIRGSIQANYTYMYSPVMGNATVQLSVQPNRYTYNVKPEKTVVMEEYVPWFNGTYDFFFSVDRLLHSVPQLDGTLVKVEAFVFDKFMEMQNSGFAMASITNSSISLRFLGSSAKVFKPGMPFETLVAVSYHDLVPLPLRKIGNSRLEVVTTATMRSGSRVQLAPYNERIYDSGVFKIKFTPPFDATMLAIRAIYSDIEGDRVTAETVAVTYFSPDRRYMHVYTSTNNPKIGEYIIFHVRTNFYVKSFHYLILAKDIIVTSGEEIMETVTQKIKTFAVPVSGEMAPSCRIVVYHVAKDREIISDSLTVPIDAVSRYEIKMELNPYKDKTGETIELRVSGDSGAFFGVSVMDAETFKLQGGNELSPALVSEMMHTFDNDYKRLNKMLWTSREGEPDKRAYYQTTNYGVDNNRTFNMAGLVVFTDANITQLPDLCFKELGLFSCMDGNCYRSDQKCNGKWECPTGFDEADCGVDIAAINLKDFRLTRKNHMDRFYDPDYGDWAWISFNLAPEGRERFPIGPVPRRPAKWILNAISMSREHGLAIISQPYQFEGSRPFFITVEMPSICTRGEQIGIRVQVFNLQPFETYVMLELPSSPHYRFVHVESEGMVKSYNPRTSSGDHQHLIWVHAHKSVTVHFPIVPTHIGSFNVSIEAFTHVGRDRVMKQLTVEPDGMQQILHTSMILDLKNQPLVIKFLDVNVTETPIVPYQRWLRYNFESPRAYVSLVGDVVGPAFLKTPVNTQVLLRRPDRSAEMQTFNFAANLWTLHYLRLTNQLQMPKAKEVFKHLNVYYAWIMAYMKPDGSFVMWRGFEPSVWLTQFVVRTFQQARFPDWEFYLYIDPNIIKQSVSWLLGHQTYEGSFYETTLYPLDRKMDPRIKRFKDVSDYHLGNVSLTAQVLITLCEVNDLPGQLRMQVANARLKAAQYLERVLTSLEDPYEVAITTYALTRASSVDAELGFNILDGMKREQEGMVYWSREEAPLVGIITENQRPYIQPRLPQKFDAMNVEATSYALLVYVLKGGIGMIQEEIVRWLNTMRMSDGGFISTQDTIIAMQALTEYTFRERLRDITDMDVSLESSASPGLSRVLHIDVNNLAQLQRMEIPNVWGHVQVFGRGSGLAILQMDVQYSIDYVPLLIKPPVKAFELTVQTQYSGRNASTLHIYSCQRWTYVEESPVSGAAVLELEIPTGYYQYQPILEKIVENENRGLRKNIRRIKITERKLHLDTRFTCLNLNVQRWFPVANLTQYLRARIYDYYAPERFNETDFKHFNLYVLSICQVCGSYQCPYCPHFSFGHVAHISYLIFIVCLMFSVLRLI